MEFALEKSPYNFDIQVQLVKLYDQLGLSPSFLAGMNSLNLKGVQLESMGYVQMRHIIDWADIQQFKQFQVKYNKFFKLNIQNLKTCKAKALTDNNYDQIENFIEYEDFIANSYFNQISRFISYLIDFIESQNGAEHSKNFFANMTESLL